jgi:hypothetical protein
MLRFVKSHRLFVKSRLLVKTGQKLGQTLKICLLSTGILSASDGLFHSASAKPEVDFVWSATGRLQNLYCVHISEPQDPHGWHDNYLCALTNTGVRWSFNGPISGMRCTQVFESREPGAHGWRDNYICAPKSSRLVFHWSSAGQIQGWRCVQFLEQADPHTWHDNYLCYREVGQMHVVPLPKQPWWTDAQLVQALKLHNTFRDRHCVPHLTWSDQLASDAQAWTEKCINTHADAQSKGQGENLGWGSAHTVVNSWYSEISNYDFNNPTSVPFNMIGHFTQLVWKANKFVGCGRSTCNGQTFWSCRYSPGQSFYADTAPNNVIRPCRP